MIHGPVVKKSGQPSDAEVSKEISKLRSEVAELRQAIDARDRTLAVVAHDLRNPLAVISQTADVLLRTPQDAQSSRHVQRIADAAERTIGLVENLLDVTAIEEGQLSIEKRWIDLSKIVLAVMESQQTLAARGSIITSIDLSPDMPRLEADDGRIREILENLIGNALKFTPPGGTVTVGARMEAAQALVWVTDTGQGIAEDDLPRLFDRFWQARKTDRRGTGLGLSICKAIVEAHGGRIWIESAVGRGTTVFFTVRGPSLPVETSATQANILLVDDIPQNLTVLQTILERPDYRFLLARSGTEALRIALRERLSVALIDIVMPGMDGLEVARSLKTLERCKDVPILFVTALGDDPQVIHRAYDAGCADYLVKPLDPEIVRKKVAVFANLNRRRD